MPHTLEKRIFKISYDDIQNSVTKAHPEMSPHEVRLEVATILRPRFRQDIESSKNETAGNQEKYGDQAAIIKNGDIFYPNYGKDGISSEELNERTRRLAPENYSLADHQASRLAAKTLVSGARFVAVEYVRDGTDNRDIQIFEIDPQTGKGKTAIFNTSTDGKLHTQDEMKNIMREKFPQLSEIRLDEKINMFTDKPLPEQDMVNIVKSVQKSDVPVRSEKILADSVVMHERKIDYETQRQPRDRKSNLPATSEVRIPEKPIYKQKDKRMTAEMRSEKNRDRLTSAVIRSRFESIIQGINRETNRPEVHVRLQGKTPIKKREMNIPGEIIRIASIETKSYGDIKSRLITVIDNRSHTRRSVSSYRSEEIIRQFGKNRKEKSVAFAVLANRLNTEKSKKNNINKGKRERFAGLRHKSKANFFVNTDRRINFETKFRFKPEKSKGKSLPKKEKRQIRLSERRLKRFERERISVLRKLKIKEKFTEKRKNMRHKYSGKEIPKKLINTQERYQIRSVKKEAFLERRDKKTESRKERRQKLRENVIIFGTAWILWLLTKPEILPVSADLRTEVKGIDQKLISLGSRPFFLLSIIWYLAQLREQGGGNKPVNKPKKLMKKLKHKQTSIPVNLNFPPQGVIFTGFS